MLFRSMANNHIDAPLKLVFWSKTLREDFKNENTNPSGRDRNILRRGSVQDQLHKMNENVIKVLQARVEMQEQLNENLRQINSLQAQVNNLQTQVTTLNNVNVSVLTNVRWVMVQNRAICRKLEIPVNEAVEARLPNASDPLPPPDIDLLEAGVRHGVSVGNPAAVARAPVAAPTPTPVAARTPTPNDRATTAPMTAPTTATTIVPQGTATTTVPQRTINDALSRHSVYRPGSNNRGAAVVSENLDSVLKYMYTYPNNGLLSTLLTGAIYLENLTTHVNHAVFRNKPGASSKIKKIFNVVDALWTAEERRKLASHDFESDNDAFTLINHLTQRVRQACHVFRSPPPKEWEFTNKSGKGVQGLANQIPKDATKTLTTYIPEWDKSGHPRKSIVTMQQFVEQKTEQLKRTILQERQLARGRQQYQRRRR